MTRRWIRFWTVPLALFWWGAAAAPGPMYSAALAQQPTTSENKSWLGSISSGIKQGFGKLGQTLNPNSYSYSKPSATVPGPEDDAISLKTKAKPGPKLYVAIARLYEQSGKPAEAEQQYQLALKVKSDYLPALLGYAQLKDKLDRPDEAIRIYQRAVRAYPQEASVHNNMGLCYSRRSRLDEAVAALTRATKLAPMNPLYRNNIAAVLVDQGQFREAFGHLKEAHNEAAAYYNMGYLLNKKGQRQAALRHFKSALRANPSLVAAKQWMEHLKQSDDPAPRRLPPIPSGKPASAGPTLPGISHDRSTVPTAPLPPPSTHSAVRPLPRVR